MLLNTKGQEKPWFPDHMREGRGSQETVRHPKQRGAGQQSFWVSIPYEKAKGSWLGGEKQAGILWILKEGRLRGARVPQQPQRYKLPRWRGPGRNEEIAFQGLHVTYDNWKDFDGGLGLAFEKSQRRGAMIGMNCIPGRQTTDRVGVS